MVFGECATALIRPLYNWIYDAYYSPIITHAEEQISRLRNSHIRPLRPRSGARLQGYPFYIILPTLRLRITDAISQAFLSRGVPILRIVTSFASPVFRYSGGLFAFYADILPIFRFVSLRHLSGYLRYGAPAYQRLP